MTQVGPGGASMGSMSDMEAPEPDVVEQHTPVMPDDDDTDLRGVRVHGIHVPER